MEDELQRREQHQRECQGQPAREVLGVTLEASAPADDGDERDERLQSEHPGQVEGLRRACLRLERRKGTARRPQ